MSKDCPFCSLPEKRIIRLPLSSVIALRDGYLVSKGHTLIIPKRHIATWFHATPAERMELWSAIDIVCEDLQSEFSPDGFNFGINSGEAAGQTVPHLHLHIIPRYHGDMVDPRGGVRHVIPKMGNYLREDTSPVTGDGVDSAPQVQEITSQYRVADSGTTKSLTSGPGNPLLSALTEEISTAEKLDIAVAFIFRSGLNRLQPYITDLLDKSGTFRLLTGDYLNASDPDALQGLLDLKEAYPEQCELYAYSTNARSFHPKSYVMFNASGENIAFVGSSNISHTALESGVEWNYRISSTIDPAGWQAIIREFDSLLKDSSVGPLDAQWLREYRQRRNETQPAKKSPEQESGTETEAPYEVPTPNEIQSEALVALQQTRGNGNKAGLVVLATGIGKTWLSAFDVASDRTEFARVLFIAHREEILSQSLKTFRRINPQATMGYYNGKEKRAEAEILFASIQTLSRQSHLEKFDRNEFDYIVVDEFHHAAANTYRRLIDYFTPKFLLGLTATPERTDGGDLLALCDENLVYRCDVPRGIDLGMLCPYHYFGVPDTIDYKNIPWRSRKFDELALSQAAETHDRANNIYQQWQKRGGKNTIGFCVSQTHANFMRDWFRAKGVACASVHAGVGSDPRAQSLEDLEKGNLQVVFAVDMFNEGVDIPALDTVMMLRPTESAIIWLQQFGRGLRKQGDKVLTVIDYIGNHRSFLLKLRTLLAMDSAGDAAIRHVLTEIQNGALNLPKGCEVTYELEAIDILQALLREPGPGNALVEYYKDFRHLHGQRPTATETYHDGYLPGLAKSIYGSWLDMVNAMGDFDEVEQNTLHAHGQFLKGLETTSMSKSYKMVLLKAMLNEDAIPSEEGITLQQLSNTVRRIATRAQPLAADFGSALDSDSSLQSSIRKNPIAAWTDTKALGGLVAFSFEDSVFRYNKSVAASERESFQQIVREIIDWRLAAYLDRAGESEGSDGFMMKVSHSNKSPILFLPDRATNPSVPNGWQKVLCDGKTLHLNFVKVAINVAAEEEGGSNVLPGLLRGWFGPDAGLPGTNFQVHCELADGQWALKPRLKVEDTELVEFKRYSREQIPRFFGEEFNPGKWNAGHITAPTGTPNHIILLVTMEKQDMMEGHQYADKFLSDDVFEWQSQNSTARSSTRGKQLSEHRQLGLNVHLFIRKTKKLGGKAAPFTYFGAVDFVDWEGDKPISIRWKLRSKLPGKLVEEFGV
jgi:superfamily II DNA or RNA helicase/diadenosine tetraphosphate (Ap4A) HIT family hydrolase